MNMLLWVLQILLAIHTGMGAVWKLSNPAQTVPSLSVIPHGIWLAMAGVEVLAALGLVVPAFSKRLGRLAPAAAICIVAEMLLFTGLDLFSGTPNVGHVAYWLVVAVICAFIAYGRISLKPFAAAKE